MLRLIPGKGGESKLWFSKRKNSPFIVITANEDVRAGDEFFWDGDDVDLLLEYLKKCKVEIIEHWKENTY